MELLRHMLYFFLGLPVLMTAFEGLNWMNTLEMLFQRLNVVSSRGCATKR